MEFATKKNIIIFAPVAYVVGWGVFMFVYILSIEQPTPLYADGLQLGAASIPMTIKNILVVASAWGVRISLAALLYGIVACVFFKSIQMKQLGKLLIIVSVISAICFLFIWGFTVPPKYGPGLNVTR